MKTMAALFVVAALALSACDGGDFPANDGPDMRGSVGGMAGAAGGDGTAGAAGAAGAYVPDPAPTCDDPTPGMISTQIACDAGGGNAPTFNASGTQCYSCPGRPIPETGCAIRLPQAVSGGMIIHGPRDIFCPFNPCDLTLCHVK